MPTSSRPWGRMWYAWSRTVLARPLSSLWVWRPLSSSRHYSTSHPLPTVSKLRIASSHCCVLLPPAEAQMMGLVIPLLISSLLPAAAAAAPPPSQKQRQFHEHVLKRVTQIGPKFPEAFRSVMQASPALRQRLEGAVRASHTPSKPGPAPSRARTQQAPSIKLKMDFSNFK